MPPHMVALVLIAAMAPLSAQNLEGDSAMLDSALVVREGKSAAARKAFKSQAVLGDRYDVPNFAKADAKLASAGEVFMTQDTLTLGSRSKGPRDIESVVDLDLLRQPSPYRKIAVSSGRSEYVISSNGLQDGLARISAVYSKAGEPRETSDCETLSLSIEQRIKLDTSTVLAVVSEESAASPGCVCEIVKSAIRASDADVDTTVAIVEAACLSAPEHMRMISQCAIAEMPDALNGIQSLLARLDPNSGDASDSAKSAKGAKSAKSEKSPIVSLPNPLDLPPTYIVPPPPVFPPYFTSVDPEPHCPPYKKHKWH